MEWNGQRGPGGVRIVTNRANNKMGLIKKIQLKEIAETACKESAFQYLMKEIND